MVSQISVYRTYISLHDEETFLSLYASMPRARQCKADSFIFDKDKRLCIAAWGLLMIALEDQGVECEDLTFVVNRFGKPSIAGKNIHFNLSHSSDYVMCVLSKDCEVGCDVERVGCYDPDLAKACMHPSEIAQIGLCLSEEGRSQIFFRHWTLKESYLKARGVGLSLPIESLKIVDLYNSIYIECETSVDRGSVLKELHFEYDYRCAVCAMNSEVNLVFPRGINPLKL